MSKMFRRIFTKSFNKVTFKINEVFTFHNLKVYLENNLKLILSTSYFPDTKYSLYQCIYILRRHPSFFE